MAVENENAVPARRNVRNPRGSVQERPREVGGRRRRRRAGARDERQDEDADEERVPKPDAETVHDRPPVLVPASRPLCPRRQMTTGVSNVEAYLSTTLVLLPGTGRTQGAGRRGSLSRSEPRSMLRFRIFPVALSGSSRYEIRSPSKGNAVRSGWWTAPSARMCARFTSAAAAGRQASAALASLLLLR